MMAAILGGNIAIAYMLRPPFRRCRPSSRTSSATG